ncbi:hypothetical protein PHET_12255 [Paragonimus heterotremus]|uniref:Uncharacterized protein n=1 Tax=Paragonimus heterotremus TaxID=100268 RepID=A0A8J4SY28_9TREM|nr:hypothetical protein PHET_12255 [Paragonimus heterotremus]
MNRNNASHRIRTIVENQHRLNVTMHQFHMGWRQQNIRENGIKNNLQTIRFQPKRYKRKSLFQEIITLMEPLIWNFSNN